MTGKTAYIGLGSNLGDRRLNIDSAVRMLAEAEGIELARISDIIETEALAQSDQPKYLNAVSELKTTLSAEDLHKRLADIEASLGRVREGKWSPRTIDLDILLFGQDVINSPDLIIPHPQMHLRSFVLKGLCQHNGDLQHPVIKESVNELAERLRGLDFAPNHDLPQLISVAGIIGVGKTTLTKKLASLLGCEVLLEPYDTNPFMPDVYAGKKELALDSQLYFLTSRVMQLDHNALKNGKIYISDYVFDKELIYGRETLTAEQLSLYEKIYQPFSHNVILPVLVIYLTDSSQNCLERIHERNRPYEQKIEQQFLEKLSDDYEQLFSNWKISPIICISMSENLNVEHLANQIKCYTILAESKCR